HYDLAGLRRGGIWFSLWGSCEILLQHLAPGTEQVELHLCHLILLGAQLLSLFAAELPVLHRLSDGCHSRGKALRNLRHLGLIVFEHRPPSTRGGRRGREYICDRRSVRLGSRRLYLERWKVIHAHIGAAQQ